MTVIQQSADERVNQHRVAPWWVRRWPTWLALALAALTLGDGGGGEISGLTQFIILLQLNYVVAALVGRRWLGWAGVPAAVAISVALQAQSVADPTVVLVASAALALAWGTARPHLRRSRSFLMQAGFMVVISATAIAAVAADPTLALYLTAAGWLAHGLWDFLHMWRNAVVSRSFAEWCGTVDIALAVGLLLL